MLRRIFGQEKPDPRPMAIYEAIVAASRQVGFYQTCGIPDTLEGRYEMLVMHGSLVTNRLGGGSEDAIAMSQGVFDHMFKVLDHSLREMGVGDMAVPKRMRRLAEAYYGRTKAYGVALEEGAPEAALGVVISRNVFDYDAEAGHSDVVTTDGNGSSVQEAATRAPAVAVVDALARYMRAASASLAQSSEAELLEAALVFPNIEDFISELDHTHD